MLAYSELTIVFKSVYHKYSYCECASGATIGIIGGMVRIENSKILGMFDRNLLIYQTRRAVNPINKSKMRKKSKHQKVLRK